MPFPSLCELNNLNCLLGFNNISEKGAESISSSISHLKNLIYLDLSMDSNNVGDYGA